MLFRSLSDACASIVTLLGFKLAGQKPDPEHPFGHGRLEYISGLIVSMVILLMGIELAKSAVEKILHPEAVEFTLLTVGILLASIRQICHRPERYAALCGAAEDDVVTPALEAAVLRAEGYAGGWVYVNKVETPQDWRNAEALAALLPGKVVAGSLWERRYRTIS